MDNNKAKQNVKDYWEGKVENDDLISQGIKSAYEGVRGLLSSKDQPMAKAIAKRKKMLEETPES